MIFMPEGLTGGLKRRLNIRRHIKAAGEPRSRQPGPALKTPLPQSRRVTK